MPICFLESFSVYVCKKEKKTQSQNCNSIVSASVYCNAFHQEKCWKVGIWECDYGDNHYIIKKHKMLNASDYKHSEVAERVKRQTLQLKHGSPNISV